MKKFFVSKGKVIAAGILTAVVAALTTFGQSGIDALVNMYSLQNTTWSTFNVTALNVGGGAGLSGILTTNVSLDFGSCGTNATVVVTQTITGVTTNDVAIVNISNPHTSFVYNCSVTEADTVTIRASNISITNNINQAAIDSRIVVFKY